MSTLFISYAQVDRTRAKPIARYLEASGYKVWWDVGLRPGENFTTEIQQQIQKADHVVVIWSRTSVDSFWVTAEVTYARSCQKPILPLRIDECMPPVPFNLLQTLSLASIEVEGPQIVEALAKAGTLPVGSVSGAGADLPLMEVITRRAHELARWEFIKSSTSIEDFRAFLARFPDGDLADLAMLRLESLRWEEVSKHRTRETLAAFLAEFPDGVKSPEARRLLHRLERVREQAHWSKLRGGFLSWGRTRSDRMLADYEEFLRQHPAGAHSAQAQAIVDRVRQELESWRRAMTSCDQAVVRQYLTDYPSGDFVTQAKAHLARLKQLHAAKTTPGAPDGASVGRAHVPLLTFCTLSLIALALGCLGAWMGIKGHYLVAVPVRSLSGAPLHLLHPYPILIGLFVALLIHVWGNRSLITTLFAFCAVLSFRYLSQFMGLTTDETDLLYVKAMVAGSLYCFGAWVAGFIVAPYMRQSMPVFFASIALGATTYPNWFRATGFDFDGSEIVTSGIFFVACTMPIAYSLLRAPESSTEERSVALVVT